MHILVVVDILHSIDETKYDRRKLQFLKVWLANCSKMSEDSMQVLKLLHDW